MVRLRLARAGRRNQTRWRIGAFEKQDRRDGKPIEYLGSYNPEEEKDEDKVHLDRERIEYWLSVGAQPSQTVASLLKKASIKV